MGLASIETLDTDLGRIETRITTVSHDIARQPGLVAVEGGRRSI